MPIANRKSSINGFTLLEVMIALAIVGATLVVSLYTLNFHADVSYNNNLNTRMLLYAKEKLRTLEIEMKESRGAVKGTDFVYESRISKSAFDEIIKLETVIRGYNKVFVMRKLLVKKGNYSGEHLQAE